jgi:hypothetical protein
MSQVEADELGMDGRWQTMNGQSVEQLKAGKWGVTHPAEAWRPRLDVIPHIHSFDVWRSLPRLKFPVRRRWRAQRIRWSGVKLSEIDHRSNAHLNTHNRSNEGGIDESRSALLTDTGSRFRINPA